MRTVDLLRPRLRSDEPAPIGVCMLAWAAMSALAWASVAIVLHAF